MDQWYVERGSARKGPFTSAQLRALAKNGQLRTTDLLQRADTQKRIAAGKFTELFPAKSAAAPVPETATTGRSPAPVATTPAPVERLSAIDPASARTLVEARGRGKRWPIWIGAGAIGVFVLAIIPLWYAVGGSRSASPRVPSSSRTPPSGSGLDEQPIAPKKGASPDQGVNEVTLAPAQAREEYRELARVLSQDYLLNGVQVAEEPARSDLQRLSTSVGDKGVQCAAVLLLKGVEIFDEQKLSAEQENQDRIRRAEETLEAARRGELTRTVTYVDTDGRQREYEVEDTWAVMWAYSMTAGSGPKDPAIEALKRRIALDSSRARAWDELLPALPERFAGPPAEQPLAKVEFLTDGPNGERLSEKVVRYQDALPYRSPFPGRYVARNIAGRDLHNVTLSVDMQHYSTLPDATLRHVYYVPVWKKDVMLEFSRNFVADPKRGGAKYHVPFEPARDGAAPGAASELQMMAGIVRMQATVWSDEARQAPTTVELHERARTVAARLLQLAEDSVSSETFSWYSKQTHQLALDELLRHVPAFMPVEDELAKRAQRLLEDFESVRPELLKKKEAELLAACAEGRRYAGRWDAPGLFGELCVLFISCDATGQSIRAEVFDPRQPELRRLLAGFIALDRSTQKRTIMLGPVIPDQGGDSAILASSVKSYRFRLNEGLLSGDGSTSELGYGSGPSPMPIRLKPAPGDAHELAEAKQRNQAAPAAPPRKPFAENSDHVRVPLKEARRREEEFAAAIRLTAVGRYAEAKRAFEKMIADYPGTTFAAAAKVQLDELNDRVKQSK